MATLKKMTRMGADVRQIARLLQAKAPENHMLAYITPEEAQMLKDRGGSGKPDAETGVPTFAPAYDYGSTEDTASDISPEPTQAYTTPVASPTQIESTPLPLYSSQPEVSSSASAPVSEPYQFAPVGGQGVRLSSTTGVQPGGFNISPEINIPPSPTYGVTGGRALSEFTGTTPTGEESIMQRLSKATGMKEESLARLGIGGLQAVLGARTARKAAEQGRQGKAETQAIAQPYQAKGAELQRAAQAGELTPQSQQALQAVQAQTAQQATARGGVGTMQSQAQVEAFRQQLLAQQYDYGLKLSGIGDQIALGAIKTGLQADQFVNELTSNYYNNIARSLLPQPAQQVVTRG